MNRRVIVGGLLAVVLSIALGGCAKGAAPVVTLTISPTNQRFASQADAQSAATKLYTRYLASSDAISRDGGQDISRIAQFVTPAELEREADGAKYLATHDLTVVGKSRLAKLQLQHVDLQSGAMTAYTCVDYSDTKVVDRNGKDVTPAERLDRQTTVSRFLWRGDNLVIDDVRAWSGKSIC